MRADFFGSEGKGHREKSSLCSSHFFGRSIYNISVAEHSTLCRAGASPRPTGDTFIWRQICYKSNHQKGNLQKRILITLPSAGALGRALCKHIVNNTVFCIKNIAIFCKMKYNKN